MLSTSGDTHLGGDDFDKRIVDFLADDFKQNEGIDLRKDRQVCIQHSLKLQLCFATYVFCGIIFAGSFLLLMRSSKRQ